MAQEWDEHGKPITASAPTVSSASAAKEWDEHGNPILQSTHTSTPRPYAIPNGTPVEGGPILPQSSYIPSAVGYGVSKLGEHAGLPGWANAAAGIVAGGATGLGSAAISKISSLAPGELATLGKTILRNAPVAGKWIIGPTMDALDNTPEPFQPVRPNPAVAAKMRFGGPVDTSGGPSYSGVGMSGAPVIESSSPTFQPNKVNPNIAGKLRFTPGAESGGSVGPAIPSRISGTPTSELPAVKTPPYTTESPVVPFQPNRVNPNIARGIRYTPGSAGDSGAGNVAPATVGTRAEMMRQLRLRQQAGRVAPPGE